MPTHCSDSHGMLLCFCSPKCLHGRLLNKSEIIPILCLSVTTDTQRQAQELISGPSLGAKAKFMSFNRTQSRAVTGPLTGHNPLTRHLYLLGLQDSPLCRKCRVMEETSAHILCECEILASLRHVHLGSFFLEPKDIQSISLGAIWSFSKASGLP